MVEMLREWIKAHDVLLGALIAISVVTFFGTMLLIPWLIVRIPVDYFSHRRSFWESRNRYPWLVYLALAVVKNLLGIVVIFAGVVMLIVPGQGILSILLGLMLMDLPGKYALECRLIKIPVVYQGVNWIRAKARKAPLELPKE